MIDLLNDCKFNWFTLCVSVSVSMSVSVSVFLLCFSFFFFAVNFIGILFNAFVGSQQGGEKKALNQHQHFGYQSKQKKIYRKNKPKKTYTHQHTTNTHQNRNIYTHIWKFFDFFFSLHKFSSIRSFDIYIYFLLPFFP